MNLSQQLTKHFREVVWGGNWTDVNLKDSLHGVSWQVATTKIHSLNTIAALVYHIQYYIAAVAPVLQGEALNASDRYSFDLPPIQSEKDWEALLETLWQNAESFAIQVEQFPEAKLWDDFSEGKYGNVITPSTLFTKDSEQHCTKPHCNYSKPILLKKTDPKKP